MKILLVVVSLVLGGGAGIDGARALDQSPALDLFSFVEGTVQATGIVQDRGGNVIQRFDVAIEGTVQGDRLVLDETFTYLQGEGPTSRVWTIDRTDQGYVGSATDIPGPAIGRSFGNALNWTYVMDLPVGDRSFKVKFDDWFWALDERRLINRSSLSKFGLRLADVTLYMERVER